MESIDELFKGRHFEREIITLCVRWYLRFKLSFRDLVEMKAERGIDLPGALSPHHATRCPAFIAVVPPIYKQALRQTNGMTLCTRFKRTISEN